MGDISKVNAMSTIVFPKRPKAAGSSEMADVENEDIMTFMAEYANGAIGTIACSRVATGRKNYLCYEIQGTKGSVRYDLERMGEVQVYFQSDNERDRGFRTVLLLSLIHICQAQPFYLFCKSCSNPPHCPLPGINCSRLCCSS